MAACFDGSFSTATVTLLVLTGWFLLRFPLASARGMMTVNQMTSPHPAHPGGGSIKKGIPLMEHGSTKTCLVALNPILAMFVGAYLDQWLDEGTVNSLFGIQLAFAVHSLVISHVLGYVISGIAHWTFTAGRYPEADIEPGKDGKRGRLTPAGWVHVVYFGEAVSLLIQIYAFTSDVPMLNLFQLTAYMTGHIWLGNHFWNRIAKPDWFPDDYSFWAPDAWAPVIFVLVVLGYMTLASARRDLKSTTRAFLHPEYPIVVYRMVPARIM